MATTTATITISSSDIADNSFSISNTATLTTAGTDTGIAETTGLGRKKVATDSATILLDADQATAISQDVTANKSAKVYIKNMNDRGNGTKFVTVLLAAVEIGRLYGGDFMFFPWCAASGKDIKFTPIDATETTLEYTCFYE
tara:strand:+ start:601 stop:1026 length:426 start_codon:yes stop_codon:yes gene_type:complete